MYECVLERTTDGATVVTVMATGTEIECSAKRNELYSSEEHAGFTAITVREQ